MNFSEMAPKAEEPEVLIFFCAWNEQIQTLKNSSETSAPALMALNL